MKSSLPLVAFLSVATAAAIESQQKTRAASFVSFEQWIEDIIADPEGDHLAPEEAVAAHEVIMNGTDTGTISDAFYNDDTNRLTFHSRS